MRWCVYVINFVINYVMQTFSSLWPPRTLEKVIVIPDLVYAPTEDNKHFYTYT